MEVTSKCLFKFVFTSKWAYETTEIIPYKKSVFNTFNIFLSKKHDLYRVIGSFPFLSKAETFFSVYYSIIFAFLSDVTVFSIFCPETSPGRFRFFAISLKIWYVHLPDITFSFHVTFSCNRRQFAETL